jgi:hypothetical protein
LVIEETFFKKEGCRVKDIKKSFFGVEADNIDQEVIHFFKERVPGRKTGAGDQTTQ